MRFIEEQFTKYQRPITVNAIINSLKGNFDDVEMIGETKNENQTVFLVNYKKKLCTAILNCFNGEFYVDDVWGVIKEEQ